MAYLSLNEQSVKAGFLSVRNWITMPFTLRTQKEWNTVNTRVSFAVHGTPILLNQCLLMHIKRHITCRIEASFPLPFPI